MDNIWLVFINLNMVSFISDRSNILNQWVQIIKNKFSGFNYININKIKYKNIKFYL